MIDQKTHTEIVKKLRVKIEQLQKDVDYAHTIHDTMTGELNKSILFIKKHGLLDKFYEPLDLIADSKL